MPRNKDKGKEASKPVHNRVEDVAAQRQSEARTQDDNQQSSTANPSDDALTHHSENQFLPGPSGAFFDRVDGEISGGTFEQTNGHRNNVTIHVNVNNSPRLHRDPNPSQHPQRPPPHSPVSSVQSVPSNLNLSSSPFDRQSPSSSIESYPPKKNNEIYKEQLLLQKRGVPLWIPEPNTYLHMQYRRNGVAIGDVGMFTSSGDFSFIFNICLPRDHPIQPDDLPNDFTPINPPLKPSDFKKTSELKAGSHLNSKTIKTVKSIHTASGLTCLDFETAAAEGAILTLPDGASTHVLQSIPRVRAYAAANVERWYRYVNGPMQGGREAKNGEIRLVIGCDKATSWGMAVISGPEQRTLHHLKYGPVDDTSNDTSNPLSYHWVYSGFAEARIGPDLEEIAELRRDDDSDMTTTGKYTNQCLFVQTLNLTLADDVFASINEEIELALMTQYPSLTNSYSNTSKPSSSNSSSNIGQSSSNSDTPHNTSQTRKKASRSHIPVDLARKRVVVSTTPSETQIFHPADGLNRRILEMVPGCRMAITEDRTWCSVINKDDEVMPSITGIIDRVLDAHEIEEENGVAFLREKKRPNPITPPPIRLNPPSYEHRSAYLASSMGPRGMSDSTRDPSKGFYFPYTDSRRRDTFTYRDGRLDDEDSDDDYRIRNQRKRNRVNPPTYEYHSAPSTQPSKFDRSHKQRVDPRQHYGTDIGNFFQAKPSYPYSQEQEQTSTVPVYDNDRYYQTSKRDPRRRQIDNSSDDWGDDDEPTLRNESASKDYSHNSQRSRVNTLAPPSSSSTGNESDFAYSSPPTSQSMSLSTESLWLDNIHRPPKTMKYQDSGPSQDYDGLWGKSWNNIPPNTIQPQTSSRNRPRQDEKADKTWPAPANQSYGFNPSGGGGSSSSNINNRGVGDERTVSGRSNMSQPSTRSIPLPNAPQYSNQVAPGTWSGPTSTSPPGAMFPRPAIFPQPFAGNYEQDLSQRFAQTSMNNSSRMPLGTIPEVEQQSVVNSKPSLHRPDMSVTSLLTTSTSTIPDKYISIGSPYLSPLRHKSHEGLQTVGWRRRKPTDTDNYISLYMTSPIVDEDTTPLWTPCPKYRATTRQWHSVEVGDIGYLEESGEFTTLFNIFHSHKGNIRRGAQPPPPHHFNKLAAQMSDVVTEVPLQRGHFYLSENIERHSGTPQGSFQFTFKRKSGRSGAIIVLPHGGTKSTLRSKFFQYPHVKQYFRENAAAWYQHVNAHPDIPNLPNGSLIFVHGTHLARTWGIATFLSKHSVREPERILFAPTDYSNPYKYQWDWTSEKWKVKSGPSPEELRNGQLLENQCIGIIGSSVVLDNQTWQSFFSNNPTSATLSSSSRKASGSFESRILSRASSISSIKVGDRPSGRRYMPSYLETQRGYEDDLFRMDVA